MAMVSLIVMEPGSAWPGHVGESESILEVSDRGEMGLRTIRDRLASLRHEGARVRVAVLACNEAADAASLARRAELANELLAGVAAFGFGRLVLSVAAHASAELRLALLSLAGSLSHARAGEAVVSVRFDEAGKRGLSRAHAARRQPRPHGGHGAEKLSRMR
jgi:hypothetical protein